MVSYTTEQKIFCFYNVNETRVEFWEIKKTWGNASFGSVFP